MRTLLTLSLSLGMLIMTASLGWTQAVRKVTSFAVVQTAVPLLVFDSPPDAESTGAMMEACAKGESLTNGGPTLEPGTVVKALAIPPGATVGLVRTDEHTGLICVGALGAPLVIRTADDIRRLAIRQAEATPGKDALAPVSPRLFDGRLQEGDAEAFVVIGCQWDAVALTSKELDTVPFKLNGLSSLIDGYQKRVVSRGPVLDGYACGSTSVIVMDRTVVEVSPKRAQQSSTQKWR